MELRFGVRNSDCSGVIVNSTTAEKFAHVTGRKVISIALPHLSALPQMPWGQWGQVLPGPLCWRACHGGRFVTRGIAGHYLELPLDDEMVAITRCDAYAELVPTGGDVRDRDRASETGRRGRRERRIGDCDVRAGQINGEGAHRLIVDY